MGFIKKKVGVFGESRRLKISFEDSFEQILFFFFNFDKTKGTLLFLSQPFRREFHKPPWSPAWIPCTYMIYSIFYALQKTFARHEHLDEEGNVFINLGRRYAGLFRCVPDLHFLYFFLFFFLSFCGLFFISKRRPCIELKKGPQLRERAERKAVKRKLVQDKQEVKAKTVCF